MWPYARALRTFQLEGDGDRARTAFKDAVRVNPHVVQYLLEPDAIPPDAPPHFVLGSKEEAAYVAESLAATFDATPGALASLRTMDIGRRNRMGKRSRTH
jgi:hypothetical protein